MLQRQWRELPKCVQDKFNTTSLLVLSVMTLLKVLFRQSSLPQFQTYFKAESERTYEDDGQTPTDGVRYTGLWVIALGRDVRDACDEYLSYYNGGGNSAIYFRHSQSVRSSDERLGIKSGEISITPLFLDDKNNGKRLSVNTNGGPFLNEILVSQLVHCAKLIMAEHETFREVLPCWKAIQQEFSSLPSLPLPLYSSLSDVLATTCKT